MLCTCKGPMTPHPPPTPHTHLGDYQELLGPMGLAGINQGEWELLDIGYWMGVVGIG